MNEGMNAGMSEDDSRQIKRKMVCVEMKSEKGLNIRLHEREQKCEPENVLKNLGYYAKCTI